MTLVQMESRRVKLSQISLVRTDEIPESVLAFSTLTTILSYIRRPRTFSEDAPTKKKHRAHLRVLNALATLLVRDVEDVAITAKVPSGYENLEAIACVGAKDGPTLVQYGALRQIWTWVATLFTGTAGNPTLVEPGRAKDLKDLNDAGL